MNLRYASLVGIVVSALTSLGCNGAPVASSNDAGIDAAAVDGGSTIDVGTPLDAQTPLDAFTPTDANTPVDMSLDAPAAFDPACIASAIHAAADGLFPIATMSGTSGSTSYTICPNGADVSATPRICTEEVSLMHATLTPTVSATHVTLVGTMPFLARDVPVVVGIGICNPTVTFATDGDASCPGDTSADALPLSIDIVINTTQSNSIQINMLFDNNAVAANFTSDTQLCGFASCTGAACCGSSPCNCALTAMNWSTIRNPVITSMIGALQQGLAGQIEAQICATSTTGSCPAGTAPDTSHVCRYSGGACAPSPALFRSGC
jgi:hypothetical protein